MDTQRAHRILVVDDEELICRGLSRFITGLGHEVETAATAAEAMQKALAAAPDLILTDLQLPDRNGLELIDELRERGLESTLIVLTAYGSIDSAVEAMRRGVYDYLTKPPEPERLREVVLKGLERSALRQEVLYLRREMLRSGRFQGMVGRSPAMLELYRLVEQIAPTNAPILILGERGTGKEVVARVIHGLSQRSLGRFVAINCAAIPENLLESELFGHERGAFTGATAARQGCLELSSEGTLFLDEIGDMPLSLQSKLLRVLEDHKVRRVGGSREIPVDLRVLAATNADLHALMARGAFREDLYDRLNVFTLQLPMLRERMEDIPILAHHFREVYAGELGRPVVDFSPDALDALQRYHWPGSVRELRNAVQRAVILCQGEEIQKKDLPAAIRDPGRLPAPAAPQAPAAENGGMLRIQVGTPLEEVERVMILETLQACNGNKTRTSAMLGITPKTLYAKLRQYGVLVRGSGPDVDSENGEANAPLR